MIRVDMMVFGDGDIEDCSKMVMAVYSDARLKVNETKELLLMDYCKDFDKEYHMIVMVLDTHIPFLLRRKFFCDRDYRDNMEPLVDTSSNQAIKDRGWWRCGYSKSVKF